MKIKDIPLVDYRNETNKNKVQDKILELPFFTKYESIEEITFEKLEAAMKKLQKKYPIRLAYIMNVGENDPSYYSMMIKHSTSHVHIATVYATSMREGYEKALLFSFHYCKKFLAGGY